MTHCQHRSNFDVTCKIAACVGLSTPSIRTRGGLPQRPQPAAPRAARCRWHLLPRRRLARPRRRTSRASGPSLCWPTPACSAPPRSRSRSCSSSLGRATSSPSGSRRARRTRRSTAFLRRFNRCTRPTRAGSRATSRMRAACSPSPAQAPTRLRAGCRRCRRPTLAWSSRRAMPSSSGTRRSGSRRPCTWPLRCRRAGWASGSATAASSSRCRRRSRRARACCRCTPRTSPRCRRCSPRGSGATCGCRCWS